MMTDKELKDWCKTCSVEPPAMKFKCPECEHNPDKEQIIIDGEKYNKCNGCKLWDGYICTGDRSYEPNAEAHRAICNEHMAKEFWKVYHELFYKTQECEEYKKRAVYFKDVNKQLGYKYLTIKQECEELKEEYTELKLENKELYRILADIKEVRKLKDHYRKALEEIEQELKEDIYCESRECGCDDFKECLRCTKDLILDIINKAKGGEDAQTN